MGSVAIRNVYVDYLLSTSGPISATDLSKALDDAYSHDQISRMLHKGAIDDKTLYLKGKQFIKSKEAKGKKCLIFDDSLQAKPHMEVNELVGWHYDHSEGKYTKGINFLSALWSDEEASVPLSKQVIEKQWVRDENKREGVWQASKTKNEMFRETVAKLTRSREVDYVLADSWYASKENMLFVRKACETQFVMALESNRCATRREKDAEKGLFKPLQELKLGKCAVKLYLKGLDFPVRVVKKVFKNEDGSSGTLYLATSSLELSQEEIFDLYKRRWKVEEYHKSLKSNCSLGKCQARSCPAQKSHFYLAAFAFLRLEKAKLQKDKNHFALMKELNILTVKYGLKVVRQQLRTTQKKLKMAA